MAQSVRPVAAEALVQDTRMKRQRRNRALPSRTASNDDRWRRAPPPFKRVEVMPEAFFTVRPARSSVRGSRPQHPGCIAFWRGSACRPFPKTSGPSLFAPPFVGSCQSMRR